MTDQKENPFAAFSNAMADAAESAGGSTVLVNTRRRLPGSGIVYAPNLILTADHIVERDDDLAIMLPDGSEHPVALAGRDPGSDIALLRLESDLAVPATSVDDEPRVGQLVLALGRPFPNGIQASLGTVSAIGGIMRRMRPHRRGKGHRRGPHYHGAHRRKRKAQHVAERYIRTDAIPYPGFSGGPLVDADGHVLGLNTSGLMRGVSLAIPVARVWQIADTLNKHGSVKRGYIGIRSQPVALPDAQQEALNREQATGLLILWVEEESAAHKGGLLVGDIIVGLGDMPVSDPGELQIALQQQTVGQPSPIELLRGGQRTELTVTIGERK